MLVEKFDAKFIRFFDETFTLYKDRTIAICQGMIDEGYSEFLTWDVETRVNCVDEEMMIIMKYRKDNVKNFWNKHTMNYDWKKIKIKGRKSSIL